MNKCFPIVLALLASPAVAEETRELDSHEHGVGELNIAFDGNSVAMELHAPGADIVGFEYEAQSETDHAAIDAAVAMLAKPFDLFAIPSAAACTVLEASAELESEGEHDEHDEHDEDHDNHKDDDGDHDDEHAEEHHDDDEHADEAGHTEFHAEYTFTCENPAALTDIAFTYFNVFENARELEVQIVSATGAQAFEVERTEPKLDLKGLF